MNGENLEALATILPPMEPPTTNGSSAPNGHHQNGRIAPPNTTIAAEQYTSTPPPIATIDTRARYRRILIFFGSAILHFIWWDILVRRIPVAGAFAARSRPRRFRRWAHRFRLLALEMGGVLIKLGQFLSARVDVLPPEITNELQGLQDEVSAIPTDVVWYILQEELGDLSQRFAIIEKDPLAAASLGQTHRAWLWPQNGASELGDAVVVKIQRPQIEIIVQTDLDALQVVSHWVMRYGPIRRRANVPALMEEFAYTLWQELDYEGEVDNAERFAAIYANHTRVYIPAVYRLHSTKRVIVLENVEGIKINDVDSIVAAGIDPKEVAAIVFDAYFQQFFRASFFHADPHPGNIFIRPRTDLPWDPDQEEGRPFWLTFVDFGMVGHISPQISKNIYKIMVSVVQRNGNALTEAYNDLGFFLPSADLDRIAEAQETLLDRMWGRNLMDLAQPDPEEIKELGQEFRDVLFEFPFQVPQDFVYLGRAIGMMSGLMTALDPNINPWYLVEKYGKELIAEQQREDLNLEGILNLLRPYLAAPSRVNKILEDAEAGRLKLQSKPDKETLYRLQQVEKKVGQLSWSILGAASIVSAALLWKDRNK